MAEIEKVTMGFPVTCDLVARKFKQDGSILFLMFLHNSTVQRRLYNPACLLGYRPSTE